MEEKQDPKKTEKNRLVMPGEKRLMPANCPVDRGEKQAGGRGYRDEKKEKTLVYLKVKKDTDNDAQERNRKDQKEQPGQPIVPRP